MRALEEILAEVPVREVLNERRFLEGKICFDSRQVEKGDLFVAIRGTLSDGHQFIEMALEKGARFIVCEEMPGNTEDNSICFIKVSDSRSSLAIMASNFYYRPSEEIMLVGITGTNGKTTTATLLYQAMNELGYKAGLISTIRVMVNEHVWPATHTTPDPLKVNAYLREMVDTGCQYAFMEVSSHAIDQKRIAGLAFRGGIFTNITHDHLNYHGTFRNYLEAKKKFFDRLGLESFALINADDRNSQVMVQNTRARVYRFALKSAADFHAKVQETLVEGNLLKIGLREVWTRLPGDFNAYNVIAVYACLSLLGFHENECIHTLSLLKPVEGRFEIIPSKRGITGIVDYAHTPDALENVLKTIRSINQGRKIITIVGSGGDRDREKRPEMAKVAANYSDRVVLTSDNPRSEDPESIINDMMEGVKTELRKIMKIVSREEAIRTACSFSESDEIILLAGKGHETYQEVKGERKHFDDREILKKYLDA